MKTSERLENWLEVLNEVSAFLELYKTSEEDKRRIKDLDQVIDEIYTFIKILKLGDK